MHKDLHYPKKIKDNVFITWKELGETPLQSLEGLRKELQFSDECERVELSQAPMTYAGRLDPLAEGELLILVGEECKKKDEYLGLDKEYEVEILLGPQTDTGDVMGVIGDYSLEEYDLDSSKKDKIKAVLDKYIGKVSWLYPAFSSKTVRGKPLFLWSLEGRIDEVELPMRESHIYDLDILGYKINKLSELRHLVHGKINSIKPVQQDVESKRLGADFRRDEVLHSWADFFNNWSETPSGHNFVIIKLRCRCSSGTYMRTLARLVGEDLGTYALALSIVRTKIVV
jgi:tRNA pseudouridine(55) synthase